MSILDKVKIVCDDIRNIPADLLVMKFANDYHGADLAVAEAVQKVKPVKPNTARFVDGAGVAADRVVFVNVGDLFDFRYAEINRFATETLILVDENAPQASRIATTIHGPGYGLDEREAFLAQLAGYVAYETKAQTNLSEIVIVELDAQRAERLTQILKDAQGIHSEAAARAPSLERPLPPANAPMPFSAPSPQWDSAIDPPPPATSEGVSAFANIPIASPSPMEQWSNPAAAPAPYVEKPKLFAAMPFAEKYMDEYDIGFIEAAHAHGFSCERLDRENYVGDIIAEIFKRIRNSAGVIALLNDNNANVFLEVGYAMALNKPVILVAHEDQDIAFDLRSQRRQTYRRIAELRKEMTELIGDLKSTGVLGSGPH